MKTAVIGAKLLKVRKLVQENRTSFMIKTDNPEIGEDGSLIVDSNILYNSAIESGVVAADLLLKAVKAAAPEDRSDIYREHENLVVGEINSSFVGGDISISVVKYAEGDRIPISKKNYDSIAEAGFISAKGEPVKAIEENGRYFIIATKDWQSVTVKDITFTKSEKAMLIEAMAKTASVRDIFGVKNSASALSIFKKKSTVESSETTSNSVPEEEHPFEEETEEPAVPTTRSRGRRARA